MLLMSSKAQYSALCLNSIKIFINILDVEDVNYHEYQSKLEAGALTHIKRLVSLSSKSIDKVDSEV